MSVIWYVLRVDTGRDAQVAHDLGRQGYQPVLAWTFMRVLQGCRAIVEAQLRLSPYVFVGVDYARQEFRPVKETLHVADYLSFGPEKRPSSVPEEVIVGIRLDEIEDYENATRRVRRKEPSFCEGDIVRVEHHSSCQGLQGRVLSVRPGSAIVELNNWPWRFPEADLSLVRAIKDRAMT